LAVAAVFLFTLAPSAQAQPPGEAAFRALFKEMVETDTSFLSGDCTALARKVQARMIASGFPEKDLHLFVPDGNPRAGALVAVLPGADPSAKAILMHGHIDVVNARKEDWPRDPYAMVEENGLFYGRGVSDMKAQDAIWADTLIRYHNEGYHRRRTLKMALTCGEEGGGFLNGAGWLAQNQRALVDAGIGFTEGGGGELDASGRKIAVTVMMTEKQTTNFVLEVTNTGGHSSRPKPDNAIYVLARALDAVSTVTFPAQFNESNRAYFTGMAKAVGGADGAAMTALLANPADTAAKAQLDKSPAYHAMLGTTCIPTLLDAGHAGNAQPQRARATINCRMLPGEPPDPIRDALVKAIANPEVKVIGAAGRAGEKLPAPPLTPAVMDPIRKVAGQLDPGVPVIAMQETFGTDAGHFIAVGIPVYGFSALFRPSDSGNIHGQNEHISVQSVMEGREFMYRLMKSSTPSRRGLRGRLSPARSAAAGLRAPCDDSGRWYGPWLWPG
jgi:acetylornithine deacetylase/succinyl-diaminopimelate desuccinylase-like protein